MKNPCFALFLLLPAVDETVFVWASENKCFLTSLASVLTWADEVVSLLFVSHSVCPENGYLWLRMTKFPLKYFLLLPDPEILGEPKET